MAWPPGLSHWALMFGIRMYRMGRHKVASGTALLVAEHGDESSSASGWQWLGKVLAETGDVSGATAAYLRCVDMGLHSTSGFAADSLAKLLERHGDLDGAIGAYYTAMRFGVVPSLRRLASLLEDRGDTDAANAVLAREQIKWQLDSALGVAGHHDQYRRAEEFHEYVIAVLDRREIVEHVASPPPAFPAPLKERPHSPLLVLQSDFVMP
jgi:hypothetical protein